MVKPGSINIYGQSHVIIHIILNDNTIALPIIQFQKLRVTVRVTVRVRVGVTLRVRFSVVQPWPTGHRPLFSYLLIIPVIPYN